MVRKWWGDVVGVGRTILVWIGRRLSSVLMAMVTAVKLKLSSPVKSVYQISREKRLPLGGWACSLQPGAWLRFLTLDLLGMLFDC